VLVVLEGSTEGVALGFELTLVMAQGRWVVIASSITSVPRQHLTASRVID